MSHLKPTHILVFFMLLVIVCTITASGQTSTNATVDQNDSSTRYATVQDMAKRVDSLQFIVVYNAELLRRDLDAKMMLMYVMLGIIIIASGVMYVLLKQTQKQRKELEERLLQQLSSAVADLEAKIKAVEAGLSPPKIAPRKKKPK